MNDCHTRDGGRCARCGQMGVPLHSHHRIGGNRRDSRPSNLVTLCAGCHTYAHAHPRDSRTMGWIVSRHGQDPARVSVWLEAGPLGRGFYRLSDDWALSLVEPG